MEIEDNLRKSDEVQDMLGQMPPWLIRYGTMVVAAIFGLIVVGAFIIKYPDTSVGEVVVTNEYPPARLVSQVSGRLRLLTENNQVVKEGQYIAYLENPTPFELVLELKENLEDLNDQMIFKDSTARLKTMANLGELQRVFNRFKISYDEYELYKLLHNNEEEILLIEKQLVYTIDHLALLKKKKDSYEREFEIVNRQYESDKELYQKEVLPKIELEESEEKLLVAQNDIYEINQMILDSEEKASKLRAAKAKFGRGITEESSRHLFNIHSNYDDLMSEIAAWEKQYVIKAPFGGHVSYYRYWNNSQYVNAGDDVAFIIKDARHLFARMNVTADRFGEVKVGQKVRIQLNSYSVAEYGFLFGKVASVSEMNVGNMYSVSVKLEDGLKTSYGYRLKYMPEMTGIGEVITKDLSIVERLFYNILKVLRKKTIKRTTDLEVSN